MTTPRTRHGRGASAACAVRHAPDTVHIQH
jgi:hypothetical protein